MLTPDLVRTSREMFEQVTALMPGAEYDGWEVGGRTRSRCHLRPRR